MSFKIALENTVTVPVKFRFKQSDRTRNFDFTLTAKRVDQEKINGEMSKDGSISEFLREVITDWSGQRLVLNHDDSPASFSPEALDAMLSLPGAALALWADYTKAIAPTKN